ncbi:MAG: phosphoribosylaminoimidazolesuccinocarboxamide synthase [Mycoplasmoidaceae bacterium]
MNMKDLKNSFYQGKSKELYQTDKADEIIIRYKNDVTAFNTKHDVYENKGIVCGKISKILFEIISANNISNHFIKVIDENHHLCKKVRMIPLEVVLRNVATGRISREYPIKEFTKFKPALIEFFYKNDCDPLITEDLIFFLNILTKNQLETLKTITHKVNSILMGKFLEIGIELIDFKIEFGFDNNNQIILADELSPDNMRLINIKDKRKLDKELYRQNIGNIVDGYNEVLERLKNGIK